MFPWFRYLLREESIFEYIILFLFSALNIQLNAAFLFVSDAGFFGIILYLVAAFENLADDFREIERNEWEYQIEQRNCSKSILKYVISPSSNGAPTEARTQREKFVNCVNFHRNLLRLTDELQNLYSPIIFFQFVMSCLQICAITLELLLVCISSLLAIVQSHQRYNFHSIFVHSTNTLHLIGLYRSYPFIRQF